MTDASSSNVRTPLDFTKWLRSRGMNPSRRRPLGRQTRAAAEADRVGAVMKGDYLFSDLPRELFARELRSGHADGHRVLGSAKRRRVHRDREGRDDSAGD